MPRISVVVPVYDVENYLATCLQSLARQMRDIDNRFLRASKGKAPWASSTTGCRSNITG